MAYQVPINQPLTETQAQLIAKIGSMKNILSLNFFKKFFIPEDEQISIFDYILKILRSMGIDPVTLFNTFLNQFFETDNIVKLMLKAAAQVATSSGTNLDGDSDFELSDPPTKSEKEQLNVINFNYLNNSQVIKPPLVIVVNAYKMQLIKDLMTLIFGSPKKPEGNAVMGEFHDPGRMDSLISSAVCGGEIFSVHNSPKERNEDLEYNRIQLRKELEKGSPNIKVSCQGVVVTMPEDPGYLFTDALPGMVSSNPITPAQALTNCTDHVTNQVQRNSGGSANQSNAETAKKSFSQMLIEKLIVHGVSLLEPLFFGMTASVPGVSGSFVGLFSIIQSDLFANQGATVANSMNPSHFEPLASCDMLGSSWSDPSLWTPAQKKKATLFDIICNMILNAVISFLLTVLINKLKSFITTYLANRAVNKQKRKLSKLQQKFSGLMGGASLAQIAENAKKVAKAAKMLAMLQPILSGSVSFT